MTFSKPQPTLSHDHVVRESADPHLGCVLLVRSQELCSAWSCILLNDLRATDYCRLSRISLPPRSWHYTSPSL